MSCQQTLKEKGYRLTPQRAMILDVLHRAEKHISAEDIYHQVSSNYPEVNKSTVYRTLDLLKGLGLVDEADLGGDKLYYHHAEKGHHHHLICTRCGRTFEVDEGILDPIKDTLIKTHNFVPELRHLPISGHCLTCK
ncbi:MAG: Fur family transcriptional regulator [Dehalococcoidia bacterium]|nr:Fur family transcriptional regulator [Dehalococcoidia bacterium]